MTSKEPSCVWTAQCHDQGSIGIGAGDQLDTPRYHPVTSPASALCLDALAGSEIPMRADRHGPIVPLALDGCDVLSLA